MQTRAVFIPIFREKGGRKKETARISATQVSLVRFAERSASIAAEYAGKAAARPPRRADLSPRAKPRENRNNEISTKLSRLVTAREGERGRVRETERKRKKEGFGVNRREFGCLGGGFAGRFRGSEAEK